MRFIFTLSLGLLGASSALANQAVARDLEAYKCILTLNRPDTNLQSTPYYMVLDSGLRSSYDAPAVGELRNGMISFKHAYGEIVSRIYVRDTSEHPNGYKITLTINEINGLGEDRELASATFRRGT